MIDTSKLQCLHFKGASLHFTSNRVHRLGIYTTSLVMTSSLQPFITAARLRTSNSYTRRVSNLSALSAHRCEVLFSSLTFDTGFGVVLVHIREPLTR